MKSGGQRLSAHDSQCLHCALRLGCSRAKQFSKHVAPRALCLHLLYAAACGTASVASRFFFQLCIEKFGCFCFGFICSSTLSSNYNRDLKDLGHICFGLKFDRFGGVTAGERHHITRRQQVLYLARAIALTITLSSGLFVCDPFHSQLNNHCDFKTTVFGSKHLTDWLHFSPQAYIKRIYQRIQLVATQQPFHDCISHHLCAANVYI